MESSFFRTETITKSSKELLISGTLLLSDTSIFTLFVRKDDFPKGKKFPIHLSFSNDLLALANFTIPRRISSIRPFVSKFGEAVEKYQKEKNGEFFQLRYNEENDSFQI